jgi:hypothetical protein
MISRELLVRNLRAIAARSRQSKATGEPRSGASPFNDGCKVQLLTPFAQEVMAIQIAVMIEYLAQHFLSRMQEVMRQQVTVNTR